MALLLLTDNRLSLNTPNLFSRLTSMSFALLLCLAAFILISFRFGESPERNAWTLVQARGPKLDAFPLQVPTVSYGLEHERFVRVETVQFKENQTLRSFLKQIGVPSELRRTCFLEAKEKFDQENQNLQNAQLFFQKNKLAYVAIPMDEVQFMRVDLLRGRVTLGDLDGIQSEYETAAIFFNGDVDSTLHFTLMDEDLKHRIRKAFVEEMKLDTAFHSGVINIVYTIKRNEQGISVGYGDVEALRYRVNQEDRTSYRFVDDKLDVEGFFNPDGSPLQQTWLASPIPGARMSSAYNLRRRHPILKRIKPHYGTDYAAPYGTPILAVSDGVVVAKDRSRSNGKFVKIRHDDTYQTQYLHMKGFARNIKPGVHVKKGQVIGYVGSTGLSNGPHVCFRFWKNGRQIDHRKEYLPQQEELSKEAFMAFEKKQAKLRALLGGDV